MATTLIALPNEVLSNIFKSLDPIDIAHVSNTCRSLYINIKSDKQLFKAVYHEILDRPRVPQEEIDYEARMKDLVKFRYVLKSPASAEEKAIHLPLIADFTSHLLHFATGTHSPNLTLLKSYINPSRLSISNLEAFLCKSQTFSRASITPHTSTPSNAALPSPALRQASAKLHVLYGKPILLPRRAHCKPPYPFAVSMVYDLRNYTEATLWGPYVGDGVATVDWEKLEAVMLVIGHNVESFRQSIGEKMLPRGLLWREGWRGANPYSYRSADIPGLEDEDDDDDEEDEDVEVAEDGDDEGKLKEVVKDPYGIEGTWMRVVCFLDFHDLFAFNFTSPTLPASIPRPALQTTEAIRLITMELRVTHSEPPGPDDGQEHPVVYFEGVSRSLHAEWDINATSNIRGSVRMTKEGEVRWQSLSVYNGEDRWRSEGIQIGGLQSARGVLGHWFDKDHDVHGPAGPTAFYKLSDRIKKRRRATSDEELEAPDFFSGGDSELEWDDDDEVEVELEFGGGGGGHEHEHDQWLMEQIANLPGSAYQ